MNKTRMEAFSDGVIAIVITIMVLELKVPHGAAADDLMPVLPVGLRYLLSFVYVGMYWINHHYLLEEAGRIGARAMWANLHLLFWISLIPFVTAWAGEHPFEATPVALYGAVLLMCSLSFLVLGAALRVQRRDSWRSTKNLVSIALYVLAIALSFWYAPAASGPHLVVAALWLRPPAARML